MCYGIIDWLLKFWLLDISFSVERGESRISILPLLPTCNRTLSLLGSDRWPRTTRLRALLSCTFCLCPTYGAPSHTTRLLFFVTVSGSQTLSAQCKPEYVHVIGKLTSTLVFVMSVILLLRTYAFTGRKKVVLAGLSVLFSGIIGATIWVTSTQLSRLSLRPCSPKCVLTLQWNSSAAPPVHGHPTQRLFRHFGSAELQCSKGY